MSWNNFANNIFKQRNSIYIELLKEEKNNELWSIRIKTLLASSSLALYINNKDYGVAPVIEEKNFILKSIDSIETTSIIKLNYYDKPLLQVQHISKLYEI